ncbi:MAG: solute carrier family 23 protein, partial [Pseudomonadales bacterium]
AVTSLGAMCALALLGLVIIITLTVRRVMGAVVISVLAMSFVGWVTGLAEFHGLASIPPSPAPVIFQLDILSALQLAMVPTILTLVLVDLFDTAGTLVGVSSRAGLLDAKGHLPNLRRALLADSSATAAGALLGTSSTTSYVESSAGVEAGGRTGVTAIVVGLLFLLALFLSPLAQSVPSYATASALLYVACLMLQGMETLDWSDPSEVAPAVITAISMPLAFSIADGIGLGFIVYAVLKIISGRAKACPLGVYLVALLFVLKFAFLD